MKIPSLTSNQPTWVETTYQFIFEDESEILARVGHALPANTGDGLYINLEWETETPEWAEKLTDDQLIELLGLTEQLDMSTVASVSSKWRRYLPK